MRADYFVAPETALAAVGLPRYGALPLGGIRMSTLVRRLSVPASESQLSIALVFALVVMSFLLWGVVWQASVISQQRQVIRSLSGLKTTAGNS